MSELTINVDDYLSESDKRRIVTDAFSAAAAAHAQKDFERIISNSAYYLVGEIVDQHFDGSMVATLKDKAISVSPRASGRGTRETRSAFQLAMQTTSHTTSM